MNLGAILSRVLTEVVSLALFSYCIWRSWEHGGLFDWTGSMWWWAALAGPLVVTRVTCRPQVISLGLAGGLSAIICFAGLWLALPALLEFAAGVPVINMGGGMSFQGLVLFGAVPGALFFGALFLLEDAVSP